MSANENFVNQLDDQLDDLASKLFNVFGKEYLVQVRSNHGNNSGENVTINNYNTYNSYYGGRWSDPFGPWYPWGYQNVVHHHHYNSNSDNSNLRRRGNQKEEESEEEKEEKKKQEDFKNKLWGTVIISGASIIATWVFSKDGFVGLWRYSIEHDINQIEVFNLRNGNDQKVDEAVIKCKEWLDAYRSRVRKPFYAKLGMFGSSLSAGASFFFNTPYLFFGSILAGTASGCYYLWNKWGYDNMDREARLFFEMMDRLKKAQTGLGEEEKDKKEEPHNQPNQQMYPDLHKDRKIYDLVSE